MKKQSKVLEFLKKANKDTEIGVKIFKAMEKGNMVLANEVLKIAKELGYSFSREEFEAEVRQDMEKRFAAGEIALATEISRKFAADPPESSCAKGCLSYTKSWHPDPSVIDRLGRPVDRLGTPIKKR